MADNNQQSMGVYLDHLIQRESLRYRRSDEALDQNRPLSQDHLRLNELSATQQISKVPFLRKPDFQRGTNAWTPEDCVALLESIVAGQVVPSIVMWKSPDELNYILDGAHRVSAIIAWLSNDWGDQAGTALLDDDTDADEVEDRVRAEGYRKAAQEVRRLMKQRVGFLPEFERAEQKLTELAKAGKKPSEVMPQEEYRRAVFYRQYLQGDSRLHILWAQGNYEQAELSFLRINKGGKVLSEWETRVVEDRNSSFVRALMSLANVRSVRHYWPDVSELEIPSNQQLAQKIQDIRSGLAAFHDVLFTPELPKTFRPGTHPFFWIPSIPDKPGYLAELLCVVCGFRGQQEEIDDLIARDKYALPAETIEQGWRLVRKARDAFDHLSGPSSNPKSLGIVPLLYFYSDKGKHVRSLLYGFLHWLLKGSSAEILQRKRAFASHREAFEQILLLRKADIVGGISRKTGSGPEVTMQVAQYFDKLLGTLIACGDDYESETFGDAYRAFTTPLVAKETAPYRELVAKGRLFTPAQKSAALYAKYFANHPTCDICGGFLDLTGGVQHDHARAYSQGGPTASSNQHVTHPFCNEPETKKTVQGVKSKQTTVSLPRF